MEFGTVIRYLMSALHLSRMSENTRDRTFKATMQREIKNKKKRRRAKR